MIDQIVSSQGWLIHQYPIRDHLLLLYILTPERLLKGFYRVSKKNPYSGRPHPFSLYWVSWKENKNACNIQSLEFQDAPLSLKGLKLFMGLYLNELIFHLCRDDEVEPRFYALYQQLLHDELDCNELLLRQFEWQILADCGYAIDFSTTCFQEKIQQDATYQFHPSSGFYPANEGILGKHLSMIDAFNWSDDSVYPIVKKILRSTIDYVLDGKSLNSRKLLQQWLTNQ